MSSGIFPEVEADITDLDEKGFVRVEYFNACKHFSTEQLIIVRDVNGRHHNARVEKVSDDMLLLELW